MRKISFHRRASRWCSILGRLYESCTWLARRSFFPSATLSVPHRAKMRSGGEGETSSLEVRTLTPSKELGRVVEKEEAEIEDGSAHSLAIDGNVRLVEVPSTGAVVIEARKEGQIV